MLSGRLNVIGKSWWFSYATIFLLQLKTIWGIWRWRDLTGGDTGYYFVKAYEWFKTGSSQLVWSPLYTSFYGEFLHLSSDAFVVTTLHRVVIVLVLAILVLALMRRLLPPGLAWAATAWWVVLPIDFDSLYEVHLFAVIPILLAVLAILWKPGPWGRGWGFAVLLIAAILVRNEYALAAALFGAVCLGWELLRVRRGAAVTPGWIRAYGIPLAAAGLLIFFFYLRHTEQSLSGALARKHEISVCQPYAFGYQQRHSDWQRSPWTECRELMTRDFGIPRPSLLDALRRNPPAILEHFSWNVQLVPNGLQVLLLNGMTGKTNPDYVQVNHYSLALAASVLIGIVVLGGSFALYRDWHYWWNNWLKDRAWAWIAMACVASVAPLVIVTQRPRPSYLLAFGIFLRAAIAICAFVIARGTPRLERAAPFAPIAMILLLALAPSYYPYVHRPRTLVNAYEELAPFHEWMEQPDVGFVTGEYPGDLCRYLNPAGACRPLDFSDLRRQVTSETPPGEVLDSNRASVLFADPTVLADPAGRHFVAEAKSAGWRLIAMKHDSNSDWELLVRPANAKSASAGK